MLKQDILASELPIQIAELLSHLKTRTSNLHPRLLVRLAVTHKPTELFCLLRTALTAKHEHMICQL